MFGELPGEVGAGVVSDPARRRQIEIDVATLAPAEPGTPRRVIALGEAKWGERMDGSHIERLRRAREPLAVRGHDTRDTSLVCYRGTGFDPALATAFSGDRVRAVGLGDLYAPD